MLPLLRCSCPPTAACPRATPATPDRTRGFGYPAPLKPRVPPHDSTRARCLARDCPTAVAELHGRILRCACGSAARAWPESAPQVAGYLRGVLEWEANGFRWCSTGTANPAGNGRIGLLPPGSRWWPKSHAHLRVWSGRNRPVPSRLFRERAASWPEG